MNKSVLISIQSKYCELIASGKKTIEVRKTRPKQKTPFKCYMYETKGAHKSCGRCFEFNCPIRSQFGCDEGTGAVIGEFVCDNIRPYLGTERQLKLACLTRAEAINYLQALDGFLWHISELKIYDTPKELGEFRVPCPNKFDNSYDCSKQYEHCKYFTVEENGLFGCAKEGLTRPPQSWCYVEEL